MSHLQQWAPPIRWNVASHTHAQKTKLKHNMALEVMRFWLKRADGIPPQWVSTVYYTQVRTLTTEDKTIKHNNLLLWPLVNWLNLNRHKHTLQPSSHNWCFPFAVLMKIKPRSHRIWCHRAAGWPSREPLTLHLRGRGRARWMLNPNNSTHAYGGMYLIQRHTC